MGGYILREEEKNIVLPLDAVERLLSQGRVLTPDLGGNASTQAVGDEIVRLLRETV